MLSRQLPGGADFVPARPSLPGGGGGGGGPLVGGGGTGAQGRAEREAAALASRS